MPVIRYDTLFFSMAQNQAQISKKEQKSKILPMVDQPQILTYKKIKLKNF